MVGLVKLWWLQMTTSPAFAMDRPGMEAEPGKPLRGTWPSPANEPVHATATSQRL